MLQLRAGRTRAARLGPAGTPGLGLRSGAVAQAAQDRADNEAAFSAKVPDRVRRHPTDLLDRMLARELNTPDIARARKQLVAAYGMRVFGSLPDNDRLPRER